MLYAVAIGLSALLLFAVEPMTVKHLLPWFGGSSEVWATSLVFFTAMLFVGYLYVYLLSRRPFRQQTIVHFYMIVIAVCATLFSLYQWHSIYPPLDWTISSAAAPAINVLKALLFAIGAPFFFLSTTGPLLQYWYGISTRKDPYILYALSNTGSLAALVGYVFLAEPYSTLTVQSSIWAALFIACAAINIVIAVRFYREAGKHTAKNLLVVHEGAKDSHRISWRLYLAWVWYGALPAFMLVATTVEITQKIAPVPLLWIVPLMIYLLAFILAFAGIGRSIFIPLAFLVASIIAYSYASASYVSIVNGTFAYLTLLFFCGLGCAAQLYRLRPSTAGLPFFYLLLSLGGMIGTLCASILAPLIFTDFWEFPLGIALSAGVAVYLIDEDLFPRILDPRKIMLTKILATAMVAYLFAGIIFVSDEYTSVRSRDFYGSVQVQFGGQWTALMHGATLHGLQLADKDQKYLPTTYYVPQSGVGRSIQYERDVHKGKSIRVGIIGLGTGTMAAYCRAGDTFVFYDIDPQVIDLAGKYFSYLAHCAGSAVRQGDGRILLEQERRTGDLGRYDVIVIDAFSDDTIPVHLLTEQAVDLYAAHMHASDSIIAVHVSNRYLDLAPIVLRLAAQIGMNATVISDNGRSGAGGSPSEWVLLSKDPSVFRAEVFAGGNSSIPQASAEVWTDEFTSLVPVLQVGSIF
ncbi:fused MFS/spermidine synthase [Candidatus Kaiserbacteria bacterium]|nr:fused MFS/spermidine synthase [Candidatus Kaiserbacteria bacterium]